MSEKMVLGLGNNIDYEITWDSQVMEELILHYGIRREELSTVAPINSERDLAVSILAFLMAESGGERFVASPAILEEFAARFRKKITLGGTSVRAAIAMGKLGYTASLHLVTLNDHVRELLPPGCPYLCSAEKEALYPHLIVQFTRDTRVKAGDIDIHTRRSNRLIYNFDKDNMEMALSGEYAYMAEKAEVFLISGFNAMQDKDLLAERLWTLNNILDHLPKGARVFYEDACYHDPSLSQLVRDALVERIHVYSLNEDELQGYLGRKLNLLDPDEMEGALREIAALIPVPRLVIHTKYWALACGKDAAGLEKALKGGITMATTRFRFGDDFDEAAYRETEALPEMAEGAAFAGALEKRTGDWARCLPSVEADERSATTIGLGDAFVGGFLPALLG